MGIKVECYAGYRADERPLRFEFVRKTGTEKYEVVEVLDQWYGVGYRCFRVRAGDGNIYILRHWEGEDCWDLDSFRRAREESSMSGLQGPKPQLTSPHPTTRTRRPTIPSSQRRT